MLSWIESSFYKLLLRPYKQSLPGRKGGSNVQDSTCKAYFQRYWGVAAESRENGGCVAGVLLYKEKLKSVTGTVASSGFDIYTPTFTCAVIEKSRVSVRIRSTDSEQMSRKLGKETEKNLRAKIAVEIVMKLTAQENNVSVRWKNYEVSQEDLGRKVSEQIVSVKLKTASGSQLESKVHLLQEDNKLSQETDQGLKRRCDEQTIVMRGSVGRLLESVAARIVRTAMYISKAIRDRRSRKI